MNALGKVAGDKLANAIGAPEESPIAQAARQQERAAAAATRPSPVASAAKSAWPIIAVAGAGLAALGTVLVLKRKGR